MADMAPVQIVVTHSGFHAGDPNIVDKALCRMSTMHFEPQPSQPAAPTIPKARTMLPKQANTPPVAAPPKHKHKQTQSAGAARASERAWKPEKRAAVSLMLRDTQTEYVRIDTAAKGPQKDLLTDHQKEVAARRRLGDSTTGCCTKETLHR